jgi:hypothetical protein
MVNARSPDPLAVVFNYPVNVTAILSQFQEAEVILTNNRSGEKGGARLR